VNLRLALLLLIAPLAAAGCRGGERAPATALPDSLLVEAIVESHLAAVRAERTGEDQDSLRAAALTELGFDEADLNAALDAYAQEPEAFARLYERVVVRLLTEHEAASGAAHSLPQP
jgi:hypothetical protein